MCIRFLCGKKGSLTCHMEQNDTRIFSYFVVGHAPVEGMVFCFVDLQRTRHFLEEKKKHVTLVPGFCAFSLLFFSFFFVAKSAQRKCTRHLFSKVVVDGDALGRVLARVVAYVSPACASQLCIGILVARPGRKEAVQSNRSLAGCGLHQTFFFSLFCKSGVVAPLCNPSIQTQGQCFLSVFSTRRRKSGWGVGGVKEKTGGFGQEAASTDKGAGREQQETGTATEEDLALTCRQKIRRV